MKLNYLFICQKQYCGLRQINVFTKGVKRFLVKVVLKFVIIFIIINRYCIINAMRIYGK